MRCENLRRSGSGELVRGGDPRDALKEYEARRLAVAMGPTNREYPPDLINQGRGVGPLDELDWYFMQNESRAFGGLKAGRGLRRGCGLQKPNDPFSCNLRLLLKYTGKLLPSSLS